MRFDYIYGEDVSGRYPNVKVTIEEITPKKAAFMLDTYERRTAAFTQPRGSALRLRLNSTPPRYAR